LTRDLKPGAAVAFEFVEHHPGEWMITSIAPAVASTAAKSHAGR
jgi:Cu(I)/Ag(I) efflux system membrane fusion protein/cobalt-zinc-cadmium efflux system membrane fusion protein